MDIVVFEPSIQVLLKCVDGFIERIPERNAGELIQHDSAEPFDEAVGLRRTYLRSAVLDLIEREVEIRGMGTATSELVPLSMRDGLNRQPVVAVERENIVIAYGHGTSGHLPGMEETEGVGTIGIHYRRETDCPDPLGVPTKKASCPRRVQISQIRHAVSGSRDSPFSIRATRSTKIISPSSAWIFSL